jgi:hypothetical protein
MEPMSTIAGINAVLSVGDKLMKLYREMFRKLPESAAKTEAGNDLKQAEDALQLAKLDLAKSFDFPLCKRHFPPGIKVDVREGEFPKWKCQTCGVITPHKKQDKSTQRRESSVRGRTDYF